MYIILKSRKNSFFYYFMEFSFFTERKKSGLGTSLSCVSVCQCLTDSRLRSGSRARETVINF